MDGDDIHALLKDRLDHHADRLDHIDGRLDALEDYQQHDAAMDVNRSSHWWGVAVGVLVFVETVVTILMFVREFHHG